MKSVLPLEKIGSAWALEVLANPMAAGTRGFACDEELPPSPFGGMCSGISSGKQYDQETKGEEEGSDCLAALASVNYFPGID